MSIRSLMNKEKVIVDDIISVVLILLFGFLVMFFLKIAIMALVVYPISTLLLYGIYKIHKGIFNKKLNAIRRVVGLLLGIGYIYFAILILSIIFSQPQIPASFIIYFLAMPTFLIGFAGFLKGLIVNTYSPLFRSLNMGFGILTIITTYIAILFADASFIFYLFSLLIALGLNGVLRSCLYLSEYGLSLKKIRNFKLVFFIINSIDMKNPEINQF